MQKIVPFLWFDGKAEQAMNFYNGIFPNARIKDVMRYGDAGPGPKGEIMSVAFEIEGQEFYALNGGPLFAFSPAISFFVKCATQDEVDHYWSRLSEGGETRQCGWLTDKFGVTWQIVPIVLYELLHGQDAAKSARAMAAMMKMAKLNIGLLTKAYEGS